MIIKLKSGAVAEVSNPVEQKVVKSDGSTGWILAFSIYSPMTSTMADEIFTEENITELAMLDEEEKTEQLITGYEKISSLIIRYANGSGARTDVQITKGL